MNSESLNPKRKSNYLLTDLKQWSSYFLFGCMFVLLLTACSSELAPRIIFPIEDAAFYNPVRLEANTTVTWTVDGQDVTVAASWQGHLTPGEHSVQAKNSAGIVTITLKVLEDFPVGKIRSFAPGQDSLELPQGKYRILWGNTSDKVIDFNSGKNKSALTAQTTRVEATPQPASWHEQLYEQSITLVQQGATPLEAQFRAQSNVAFQLGSERKFSVLSTSGTGADEVTATLYAMGAKSLVYVDTAETVDFSLIDKVVTAFEGHIYERVTTLFGQHSDVDNNGRVILLFTPTLNASKRAIGFFYAGDLLKRDEANPYSNEAEVLYLGIPEMDNFNFSTDSLAATSCHEFQHLINFSVKTLPYINNSEPPFESLAINEGLSHLAEDLCGYNTLGGNVAFVARFLQRPHEVSLTSTSLTGQGDSIERRGAAYLFLRYLFEQAGGVSYQNKRLIDRGGAVFLNNVVDSRQTGLENVVKQAKLSNNEALWQWWWALCQNGMLPNIQGYKPLESDTLTGDQAGIDLYAGTMTLANTYTLQLAGPQQQSWPPTQLAPASVSFYETTGGNLVLPEQGFVQLLRLE